MKNHVNALIVAGVIITSTGCTAQTGITENDLIGNWIEIMPVNVQFTQGVTLQKEGVASSIGMATLKYESWELKDGKSLILNGQSIGNRQTISFSDTLSVISLQNDTLTLGKGDKYRIQYTRQADAPQPIGGSDAYFPLPTRKPHRPDISYLARIRQKPNCSCLKTRFCSRNGKDPMEPKYGTWKMMTPIWWNSLKEAGWCHAADNCSTPPTAQLTLCRSHSRQTTAKP